MKMDNLVKLVEGEVVEFEFKLGFKSAKSNDRIGDPVVRYGKFNDREQERTEQLNITLKNGEITNWIKADFDIDQKARLIIEDGNLELGKGSKASKWFLEKFRPTTVKAQGEEEIGVDGKEGSNGGNDEDHENTQEQETEEKEVEVKIPDNRLKQALLDKLKKESDEEIIKEELEEVTELILENLGIENIEGLEYATNLRKLKLDKNKITDFSPLFETLSLEEVEFSAQEQKIELEDNTAQSNELYVYESEPTKLPIKSYEKTIKVSPLEKNKDIKDSDGYLVNEPMINDQNEIYWSNITSSTKTEALVFYEAEEEENSILNQISYLVSQNTTLHIPKEDEGCDNDEECVNEGGVGEIENDTGNPIVEGDDVDWTDGYEYVDGEGLEGVPVAREIEGTGFKEEIEAVFVEVNPDKEHPWKETNWENNLLKKDYKSVNEVYDVSVNIVRIEPRQPTSNQNIEVTYRVCNNGNQLIDGFEIENAFRGYEDGETIQYSDKINRGMYVYNKENQEGGTTPVCIDKKIERKMFDVETSKEDVIYDILVRQEMPKGEKENNPESNKDAKVLQVRNPNVSVYIQNENEEADVLSETGDAHIVIRNEMYRDIAIKGMDANGYENDPEGSKMNPSDTTKTVIKLRDENLDKEIATYTEADWDKSDIGHGEIASIKVSDEIRDFIDRNYDGNYQSVEISVEGHIPYYKGEVDYSGNPKYGDNELDESIYYFPPRPNISMMQCNELDASAGQLGIGSDMPVKACAGHYPNNPSTAVEEGMQAYHYVMYRFFPAPLPPYDIESVGTDNKHNPEYFNQIIKLEEHKNKRGDKDAFIFDETKTNNGAVSKRGRFLPTGATFDFSVTEKHGSEKGKTIASGKVEYNITDSYYNSEQIDTKD